MPKLRTLLDGEIIGRRRSFGCRIGSLADESAFLLRMSTFLDGIISN